VTWSTSPSSLAWVMGRPSSVTVPPMRNGMGMPPPAANPTHPATAKKIPNTAETNRFIALLPLPRSTWKWQHERAAISFRLFPKDIHRMEQ